MQQVSNQISAPDLILEAWLTDLTLWEDAASEMDRQRNLQREQRFPPAKSGLSLTRVEEIKTHWLTPLGWEYGPKLWYHVLVSYSFDD